MNMYIHKQQLDNKHTESVHRRIVSEKCVKGLRLVGQVCGK